MDVNVAELRGIVKKLLVHLEETDRNVVVIDHDFYWSIPAELRYDTYAPPNPSELTLGQLSDDLNELQNIKNGKRELIGYALVWAAAVLRALGEETVY